MRYLLVIGLLVLSGCGQRWCAKYYPPERIDTSWTDTVIVKHRDTVMIVAPPDYGLVEALFACDSMGEVYIREIQQLAGKKVVPTVTLKGGKAKFECRVDSMKVFAIIWNKTVKIKNVKAKNTIVEVNKITWWQKTQIIGFWVVLGIFAVIISYIILTKRII